MVLRPIKDTGSDLNPQFCAVHSDSDQPVLSFIAVLGEVVAADTVKNNFILG